MKFKMTTHKEIINIYWEGKAVKLKSDPFEHHTYRVITNRFYGEKGTNGYSQEEGQFTYVRPYNHLGERLLLVNIEDIIVT